MEEKKAKQTGATPRCGWRRRMDRDAAERYLDLVVGAARGHVAVARKGLTVSSWDERTFPWPSGRNALLRWAADHATDNIFICPAVRKSPTRAKGDGLDLRWLWADVDWQLIPREKRGVVLDRIKRVATFAVFSGTRKNLHVYVSLADAAEVRDHLMLNTSLKEWLYADAKQADNSLLRLPGTTNWKTPEGSLVRMARGTGRTWLTDDLGRLLPSVRVTGDGCADWTPVDVSGVPARARRLAHTRPDEARWGGGNRSKALWAVIGELIKLRLAKDQIHTLMDECPLALSRRNPDRVHQDIAKRWAQDVEDVQ